MNITFICYLLPLVSLLPQSCVLAAIEVIQKCTNESQFSTIKLLVKLINSIWVKCSFSKKQMHRMLFDVKES
jgi:hypothetical protein